MTRLTRRDLMAAGAALGVGLALPGGARALTPEEELVERCRITVLSMISDQGMRPVDDNIRRAKAVLIFPAIYKGGFILGAQGGKGVLLARRPDGSWSFPAFFFLGAASVGLQIGGQVAETILTVMYEDALEDILTEEFKLGADASVAVGPMGKGLGAGNTGTMTADIYVFARAEGLYGGVSFEGAIITDEPSSNRYYYNNTTATSRQIVLEGAATNPHADGLRAALPV